MHDFKDDMRDSNVQVKRFSSDALIDAYTAHTERAQVEEDNQRVRFLFQYLTTIGVETLVIEDEYTDGDYLDDYVNYYARSDKEFARRCRRLHFFRGIHSEKTILRALLRPGGPAKRLREAYAGFSVVRPLPDAVVGRTVVATYEPVGTLGQRFYPATHEYRAHLFGAQFTVTSLAFQEQDTVLAACATVALWSALHQAAALFHTGRKSPAQITQMATISNLETRPFPSRGLKLGQMCAAIKSVGLEPEVVTCRSTTPLLSMIYAYLNAGLPVVLLVHIEGLGYHAITINGYLLAPDRVHTYETTSESTPLIGGMGLRIPKLFGHDDQICPFARLFAAVSPNIPAEIQDLGLESEIFFTGSWVDKQRLDTNGEAVRKRITPVHLIVPIYHKIRLTYLDIEGHVATFTRILQRAIQNLEDAEWDIRLTYATAWKQGLRDGAADESTKARMLAWQLPKYLWVATLRAPDGTPILEMLFDATGIRRSLPLLEIVYFDAGTKERILAFGRVGKPEHFKASRRLIGFLRNQVERSSTESLGVSTPSRTRRTATSRNRTATSGTAKKATSSARSRSKSGRKYPSRSR